MNSMCQENYRPSNLRGILNGVAVGVSIYFGSIYHNPSIPFAAAGSKDEQSYGVRLGFVSMVEPNQTFNGINLAVITYNQGTINGLNLNAIASLANRDSNLNGLELAAFGNGESEVNGVQASVFLNKAVPGRRGCLQVGLANVISLEDSKEKKNLFKFSKKQR